MKAGEDVDHCFGSYQDIDTGREWIQCICRRWLYEDCVHNEDIDSNGKIVPPFVKHNTLDTTIQ